MEKLKCCFSLKTLNYSTSPTFPMFPSNLLVIIKSLRCYRVSFNLDPGTTYTYVYNIMEYDIL